MLLCLSTLLKIFKTTKIFQFFKMLKKKLNGKIRVLMLNTVVYLIIQARCTFQYQKEPKYFYETLIMIINHVMMLQNQFIQHQNRASILKLITGIRNYNQHYIMIGIYKYLK